MGLLREWAERADAMGIRGTLINQILKDDNFEQHVLEAFSRAALPSRFDRLSASRFDRLNTRLINKLSAAHLDKLNASRMDNSAQSALIEATTSDFEDFVGKDTGVDRALLDDWRIADSSWYKFVDIVPLSDMKTVIRLRRSDTDSFQEVLEGGEHVQGSFSSYKVEYTPKKYELGLNFTWEIAIS